MTRIALILFVFIFSCKESSQKRNEERENELAENIISENSEKKTLSLNSVFEPAVSSGECDFYCAPDLATQINDLVYKVRLTLGYGTSQRRDITFPYLLKSNNFYFSVVYPNELVFRHVPTVIDTLIVVAGSDEPSSSIKATIIEDKNENTLFYELRDDSIGLITKEGELDSILQKRNISLQDLYNNDYIVHKYSDWKDEVPDNCFQSFINFSDLRLLKLPDVEEIGRRINKTDTTITLDTLKAFYEKQLVNQNIVSVSNMLYVYNNNENSYGLTGGFKKNIDINILLLIDKIEIIYISRKNEIFKVKWIDNFNLIIDDSYSLICDDVIKFTDEGFKTENGSNLFHPDMVSGNYLTIFQVKPKYFDTYIQSPVEILNFTKPD
ncbi:MAG: hypothetical protein JW717_11345 [Marinilabiliaceae bacterium]|nr:hypothetical protein [Marinilabiliaceae bacterium]